MLVNIVATNLYGHSIVSNDGNGALIKLVPDAPVDLVNDLTVTSDSVVRITWSDGVSNGGSSVLDYRISYDQSTGSFIQLATGVLT